MYKPYNIIKLMKKRILYQIDDYKIEMNMNFILKQY